MRSAPEPLDPTPLRDKAEKADNPSAASSNPYLASMSEEELAIVLDDGSNDPWNTGLPLPNAVTDAERRRRADWYIEI